MSARLVAACLLAICIGCGKPSASSPSPARSTADNAIASADSAAAAEAQIAATLNELTQAVRRYGAEQRRVPKTLDELVANGYLSSVPQAPAGKRFAIDKNLQVYL